MHEDYTSQDLGRKNLESSPKYLPEIHEDGMTCTVTHGDTTYTLKRQKIGGTARFSPPLHRAAMAQEAVIESSAALTAAMGAFTMYDRAHNLVPPPMDN